MSVFTGEYLWLFQLFAIINNNAKKVLFYFHVYGWFCLLVCLCVRRMQCPWEPEAGATFSGSGVTEMVGNGSVGARN